MSLLSCFRVKAHDHTASYKPSTAVKTSSKKELFSDVQDIANTTTSVPGGKPVHTELNSGYHISRLWAWIKGVFSSLFSTRKVMPVTKEMIDAAVKKAYENQAIISQECQLSMNDKQKGESQIITILSLLQELLSSLIDSMKTADSSERLNELYAMHSDLNEQRRLVIRAGYEADKLRSLVRKCDDMLKGTSAALKMLKDLIRKTD